MPFVWPLVQDITSNPPLVVKRESRTIHPSSMGITLDIDGRPKRFGGCNRSQYYRLMNYPTTKGPMDFTGKFVTQCGNFVGELLDEVFKRGWVYIGSEVPVSITRQTLRGTKYRISGRIDHVIKDPATSRPIFIELKTGGDYKAEGNCKSKKGSKYPDGTKQIDTPLLPDQAFIIQVMPYLWWVREELGVEDPEFNIMVFTRGRSIKGEHIIRLHKDDSVIVENADGVTHLPEVTIEKVFADADALADAVRFKELPERPFQRSFDQDTLRHLFATKRLGKTDWVAANRQLEHGPGAEIVLLNRDKTQKGDWQCNPLYCDFGGGCYSDDPSFCPGGVGLGAETSVNVLKEAVSSEVPDPHVPENPL